MQVHTKPQPCLAYEIWQDHSLKEAVCNTLWQWLTWVLIEMGRNVETLHIWAPKIGQFSSQKPPSFIAAAGVETYELIWKILLLVLMGATTLRSFNYTMSCCVSLWNDTKEHVVTWDNCDELHLQRRLSLKGVCCGKSLSAPRFCSLAGLSIDYNKYSMTRWCKKKLLTEVLLPAFNFC